MSDSTAPQPPVLELTGGAVSIAGRPILRGIDLTVRSQEFLALMGAVLGFLWVAHTLTLLQQVGWALGIVAGLWAVGRLCNAGAAAPDGLSRRPARSATRA